MKWEYLANCLGLLQTTQFSVNLHGIFLILAIFRGRHGSKIIINGKG
jgi:hypothetical protein